MNRTKLSERVRQLTWKQTLSLLFLCVIFYVGAATLPATILYIGTYLQEETEDLGSTKDKIDEAYRGMLDFQRSGLQNKGVYINLNGLMARLMGQRYLNERVKLDNGHLAQLLTRPQNIASAAAQMTEFYQKQREHGGQFLFVLAPGQIPKYEDILPAGYEDYSNESADNLLEALLKEGVPVLDLREEMYFEGISYEDAFFITDHHWKAEAGFWAYTKIVARLEEMGLFKPIDPMYTDLNSFSVEVEQDWFLGSSGKRTGVFYAGVDDFAIITPNFETEMSMEIPSASISRQGAFSEVALNWSSNRLNYFSANPYALYGFGDRDLIRYRNETAPIALNCLSIGNSFNNTVSTFLPLVIQTCDELDMRHYQGDFSEYYSALRPDVVIILVHTQNASSPNTTYDFFPE